jgi:hypothetical protein
VLGIASLENRPEAGVLVLKPGVVARAGLFSVIGRRFAERGYVVERARVISPRELRRRSLAARHYYAHWARARASWITTGERERLVELHGSAAADNLPVRGAFQHLAKTQVDTDVFADWVDETARWYGVKNQDPRCTNVLSDVCDVQLVSDPSLGGPAFVLNPQVVTLARDWNCWACPVVALLLRRVDDDADTWDRVRAEVLGIGDAESWPPRSLRGALRDGHLPLQLARGDPVTTARSGIHLSNGPVEAMREAALWTRVAPIRSALGCALSGVGVDPRLVAERPFLRKGDNVVALIEATSGSTIDEVVELVTSGDVQLTTDGPEM